MSDTNKRPVDTWRRDNLRSLLMLINKDDEAQAKKSLVEAITKSSGKSGNKEDDASSYLRKFLNGQSLGRDWLNRIERGVRYLASDPEITTPIPEHYLQDGFLDMPPQSDVVAYVLAAVRVGSWDVIYSQLKDIHEVKEASLVYGATHVDAIIKIESTLGQINNLILEKISGNPNIYRTQTLHAVPHSQWQKDQFFRMAEPNKLPQVHHWENQGDNSDSTSVSKHVSDQFDHNKDYYSGKIQDMIKLEWSAKQADINKIRNGDIVIKRQAILKKFREIMVDAARYRILAVVVWNEVYEGEEERTQRYLKAQADRLQMDRNFEVRRVFVVEQVTDCFNDIRLCTRIGQELDMGIKVGVIAACDWPAIRADNSPCDFGVIDNFATWKVLNKINKEGMRQIDFSISRDGKSNVQQAESDFEIIWGESRELDANLRKQCLQAFRSSKDNV